MVSNFRMIESGAQKIAIILGHSTLAYIELVYLYIIHYAFDSGGKQFKETRFYTVIPNTQALSPHSLVH